MERQSENKIRSNWVKIKVALCGSSRQLLDRLYQSGIIDIDTYEQVQKLSTLEQVDQMLQKVVQRNECEKFFEHLLELGYSSLCKEITESGSLTKTTDSDTGSNTKPKEDISVVDAIRNMEQRSLEREKKNAENDRNFEQRKTENDRNFEQIKAENDRNFEQMKAENDRNFEHIKETLKDVVNINAFHIDKCNKLENSFASLKISHEYARNEINRLTELLKGQTSENVRLERDLKIKREEITKLTEQMKRSETEVEIAQIQKDELKQLEKKYEEQNKLIHTISKDLTEHKDILKGKDIEYERLSFRLIELNEENENLKQKLDRESTAKSTEILNKINKMIKTYEQGLSIVGKQNVQHARPVKKCYRH